MASVKETAIDNLISVDYLCPDCACKDGHPSDPDFLQITSSSDEIGTILNVTSEGVSVPMKLSGVQRRGAIIEAFNQCEGPVTLEDSEIVCGAVAALRRKKINGREKI